MRIKILEFINQIKMFLEPIKFFIYKVFHSCKQQFRDIFVEYKKVYLSYKILKTAPIQISVGTKLQICSTTSHEDYIFLILSIKSFLHKMNLAASVLILDDGTLQKLDKNLLKKHLVNAQIISKEQYEKKLIQQYGEQHIFYQKKDIPYVIKKIRRQHVL